MDEIIQKSIEKNLQNLSVQLGMPIEQVKTILQKVDKESKTKGKQILILSSKVGRQKEIADQFDLSKGYTKTPLFKSWTEENIDTNGIEVILLNNLDRKILTSEDLEKQLDKFAPHADILCLLPERLEFNRSKYKSKIGFANSPERLEQALLAMFN